MSEEAQKHYKEFIEKFTAKHNITIQEAELHLVVKEYIEYINKEFPE